MLLAAGLLLVPFAMTAQAQDPSTPWVPTDRLTHVQPTADSDFGQAVDVDGDVAVVGDPSQDRAHVYEWTGATWLKTQTLNGPDGFGSSVAVDGDTLVVGAPWASSAHVFAATSGTWENEAVLTVAEASCLGSAVDLSDGVLVAGDPCNSDTAYVFESDATGWSQTTAVHVTDEPALARSVATDGQTVVAGGGLDSYVVEQTSSGWTVPETLTGARGQAVDVSGDTLVAGGGGSAAVFESSSAGWELAERLSAEDLSLFDTYADFGAEVAIAEDTIVVGAPRDDPTPALLDGPEPVPEQCIGQFGYGACVPQTPGAAYVFQEGEDGWSLAAKLAGDPIGNDRFGIALALDDDAETLLAGAPLWSKSGARTVDASDSVHVFERVI